MNSKKVYDATLWSSGLFKRGYCLTKYFVATSLQEAAEQAEGYADSMSYELRGIKPKTDFRFEYELLGRLMCDCDYYLGFGTRNAQHCLWAHDEQEQINKMRELYDLLPVKPEWLTREQIDEYAAKMNVK